MFQSSGRQVSQFEWWETGAIRLVSYPADCCESVSSRHKRRRCFLIRYFPSSSRLRVARIGASRISKFEQPRKRPCTDRARSIVHPRYVNCQRKHQESKQKGISRWSWKLIRSSRRGILLARSSFFIVTFLVFVSSKGTSIRNYITASIAPSVPLFISARGATHFLGLSCHLDYFLILNVDNSMKSYWNYIEIPENQRVLLLNINLIDLFV